MLCSCQLSWLAPSGAVPTTPSPHYTGDYDYEEPMEEGPGQTAQAACDYNPCRHLQKPCKELQNISQCSCPGTSREDQVPDAPRLRAVIEITDSSAQIRWCAPNSVVHSYELMLRAQDSEDSKHGPGQPCPSPGISGTKPSVEL
uniref:Uncharacterized protein n=1 Tax=Junco hyemalis TaxID=40217 RepID=A0A8C5IC93_JUNHY